MAAAFSKQLAQRCKELNGPGPKPHWTEGTLHLECSESLTCPAGTCLLRKSLLHTVGDSQLQSASLGLGALQQSSTLGCRRGLRPWATSVSAVLPCKQAWVLPRFKYLLLDTARQKGPLEFPDGPQPPGGWREGAKRLKVPSLGPWAQVGPSESSNRLRRFRGSKAGKVPCGGSESMSLRSRESLGGEKKEK